MKLTTEEMEAHRLHHINDMERQEAADKKCALLKVLINRFYIQLTKKLLTL